MSELSVPRRRDRPWLHAVLFVATFISTFVTFFAQSGGGVESTAPVDQLWGSLWFSLSVMLILTAHEMGHFLMARHQRRLSILGQ